MRQTRHPILRTKAPPAGNVPSITIGGCTCDITTIIATPVQTTALGFAVISIATLAMSLGKHFGHGGQSIIIYSRNLVAAALKSAQHNFGEGAQVVDVQIDVSLGAEAVERSLKELHTQLLFPERVALYRSAAIYPVVRRPVLTNLHRHLAVYKWHKRFPDMADEEIADRVGYHAAAQANGISRSHLLRLGHSTREIDIELRRSKRKAVQHDLRCAHMLIEGVGRGEFPVRTNA